VAHELHAQLIHDSSEQLSFDPSFCRDGALRNLGRGTFKQRQAACAAASRFSSLQVLRIDHRYTETLCTLLNRSNQQIMNSKPHHAFQHRQDQQTAP
jgi:hypothetical protein